MCCEKETDIGRYIIIGLTPCSCCFEENKTRISHALMKLYLIPPAVCIYEQSLYSQKTELSCKHDKC